MEKFEVVYKKRQMIVACGPCEYVYEIKFHLTDENKDLYLYFDIFNMLTIAENSILDIVNNNLDNNKPIESLGIVIEQYEGFENARKSQYHGFVEIMEKFVFDKLC